MNAIVLVANGLRLDYIGCYGNDWVQTPNLDQLAAEGVVFDQHFADQPNAAGAQRAWQTGCYRLPRATALEDAACQEPASLFPLLAAEGVGTFLVSDDKVDSHPAPSGGWQHIRLTESTTSRDELRVGLAQALDHLGSCRQWLLRLDLGVLLPPWNTPDEFQSCYSTTGQEQDNGEEPSSFSKEVEATEDVAYEELQNRYAAAVTHLDALVGHVLAEVEERGLLNNGLVLVTADHGQKLGEDAARPGSRLSLHEELIHIPLLLRLPRKAEAGRRIAAFTQSVDLLPTLVEAFSVRLPAAHGQSLLPLATGQRNEIRAYACAGLRTGEAIEWSLRIPQWAFLLPLSSPSYDALAESELYVKPDDRWEVNNVRHPRLVLARRLRETLWGFVEATRRPGPLQPPELPDLGPETATEDQDYTTKSAERSIPP
jgi:hypothetical protein